MKFSKGTVAAVFFLIASAAQLLGQFAGGTGSSGDPYQVAEPFHLYSVRMEPFAHYIQIADIDLNISPWNEFEGWEPIGMDFNPFTGSYTGNGYKITGLYIERPAYSNIGLFGFVSGGTLVNIEVNGAEVTGGTNSGILAGYLTSGATVSNCSSSGVITGSSYTGGLIGYNDGSTISGSYSAANVNGGMSVGGLSGENGSGSFITDCYARGAVTASDMAGGLTGYCMGSSITNCYATGSVSIEPWNMMAGGLIPFQDMSVVTDCYWDIEISGQTVSFGGTGKTTAQMKDPTTFSAWDFITPVWSMDSLNSGYPYLAWSVPEMPVPEFAGGAGTELDPYLIAEAYQLDNVRDHLDAFFIQIADIDLGVAPWNENQGWVPIGSEAEPFTGSYNGGGFDIENLTISRGSENFIGFFGFTNDVDLKNIVLTGVNITGQSYTGSIAGYCYDMDPEFRSVIEGCSSSGTIACGSNSGGPRR
jgi:hypothetical protein